MFPHFKKYTIMDESKQSITSSDTPTDNKPLTAEEFLNVLIRQRQGKLSSVIWATTAVEAIQQYSAQQNAALIKEVNQLKGEIKRRNESDRRNRTDSDYDN